VARNFHRFQGHVFIAAAGIVVRCIGPHLRDKTSDPAVVVLDQHGRHVVSLLSGHLGGANDLARRVAALTGGEAVITTATDSLGVPAIDILARDAGLAIADPGRLAAVNAALVEGVRVTVHDPFCCLDPDEAHFQRVDAPADAAVIVDVRRHADMQALILHPPLLVAGVGCRRGVSREAVLGAVDAALESGDLARKSLCCLASIDLKADEAGLLAAARKLGVVISFYPGEALAGTEVPTPSSKVEQHVGVNSVCEASAMKRAGTRELLVPKLITGPVTAAVALLERAC
jgi:cobalamin biosynthesis protein CbiG